MRLMGFVYICVCMEYTDGSVHNCSNSSALAIEILQFCTKPSICRLIWKHRTWKNVPEDIPLQLVAFITRVSKSTINTNLTTIHQTWLESMSMHINNLIKFGYIWLTTFYEEVLMQGNMQGISWLPRALFPSLQMSKFTLIRHVSWGWKLPTPLGRLLLNGLNLIPACIRNHVSSKAWNEIHY